jgi:hypothetical protein
MLTPMHRLMDPKTTFLARAWTAAIFAVVTAMTLSACARQWTYTHLTASSVIGAWKFPDGSWVVIDPGGKMYVDPLLYGGTVRVPFAGNSSYVDQALPATWEIVEESDGSELRVTYTSPSSVLLPLLPENQFSVVTDLRGCVEGGGVTLFEEQDPDSPCDSTSMLTRIAGQTGDPSRMTRRFIHKSTSGSKGR